jgi:hypothetical protein
MSDAKYNTNLAAEFHVLSVLHRLGADATLTLGNKKSVDIVVIQAAGQSITIDVKGLAGVSGWPVENAPPPKKEHFYVFVCFGGKIADPTVQPEVWVVPSLSLKSVFYTSPKSGRCGVPRSTLRKKGARFRDAWHLIIG